MIYNKQKIEYKCIEIVTVVSKQHSLFFNFWRIARAFWNVIGLHAFCADVFFFFFWTNDAFAAKVKHPNRYLCSQVFHIPVLNFLGIALVLPVRWEQNSNMKRRKRFRKRHRKAEGAKVQVSYWFLADFETGKIRFAYLESMSRLICGN